ncbi:MAG: TonB-dependent receptor, partial [Gammaproteobacteria bacterium]|nr:TonB-dependent receptor [Gammaproteobacteria bacterium]
MKDSFTRVGLVLCLVFSPAVIPVALAAEGVDTIEEVVVTGSRRAGRTATDSPVPVDVVTGDDFQNQGTSDMDDMLRNLLPSYNVQRYPISDAASITRPATMRGLPPDSTLVLVNGKRRHRAAVIAELGGSLAAGSQGPDMSVFPALAIKRVEVLRDRAASQYGSDAIAGVINIWLKDDNQGLTFEAKYGEFYEGDGEFTQYGINWGLPLGDNGFANLTLQIKSSDATSRSLQKTNAVGQIAAGNTVIINPVQVWGAPEIDDDYSFFINSGIELTDSQELYAFGNYAERKVTGGFFFRNPNGRPAVFTEDFGRSNRAIVDLDLAGQTGQTSNCPVLLSAGRGTVSGELLPTAADQAIIDADQAALAALPSNCWVVNNVFPGGYTPSFGGDVEDIAGVFGMRGTLDNGLGYDFSVGLARNETAFRISNTGNWSLGPASPNSFDLGKYIQTEQTYNADFVFPLEVGAFYSDLNVAFGLEYRAETFEIRVGEEDSWQAGPFGVQNQNFHSDGVTPLLPMVVGAHGFAGFSPAQAGEFERSNFAVYTDLEADITENFLLGFALRFEDFDDFGTTTNGKISAR